MKHLLRHQRMAKWLQPELHLLEFLYLLLVVLAHFTSKRARIFALNSSSSIITNLIIANIN